MKAIAGATLIDGTGAPPRENSVVLVKGATITAVGKLGQLPIPEGAELIDANGLTLLPGLIDCHDHLAEFDYALISNMGLADPPSEHSIAVAGALKQTLETGYTTVRDAAWLGVGFKQAVDSGMIPDPNLHLTLNFLTITGGVADRITPSGHAYSPPSHSGVPSGVAGQPRRD